MLKTVESTVQYQRIYCTSILHSHHDGVATETQAK